MLEQAERIARELDCTIVKLEPRSLDREQHTDDALIRWYERKGYVQCDLDSSKWTKSICLYWRVELINYFATYVYCCILT